MKNLSALQKEIYLNEQKILKEYKNSINFKKDAIKADQLPNNTKNAQILAAKITKNSLLRANLERKQERLNENINGRSLKLKKAHQELVQLVQNVSESKTDLNSKTTKMHKKWRSQLILIQKEITSHKNLVSNHDQAIKNLEEKKIELQKKKYIKEKKKLFSNVPSLLSSPKNINNILKPLAEKKDDSSIGLGDVSKAALSGGMFAIKNISPITRLLASAPYYIKEAKKIPQGRKASQETSFFLKLLEDKDTTEFIKKNSDSIGEVIDTVAPTITSIIFREIGELDELNKKLESTKKQFGELSGLQKSLVDAKEKIKNKENPSELEKATIANLEKGINTISSLENKIKIATAVKQLQDKGIDSKYISTKILPVAIEPIKALLKKPQDSLDIVNSLTNIAISKNPGKEFVKSFNSLANKIDIETILESSNFKDFLAKEGPNLANIALAVIQNSDTLKEQTKKFGLKQELIGDAISTSSVIASTLLSDTKKIDKAYKSFFDLSLSTKEENLNKVSTFVDDVSSIVLKDDTMNALKKTAPNFLKTHQEDIGKFVSNIPDNLKNNIVGKFVDGVKKESVVEATKATSNVVISVLENLSNEDIRDVTSSVQKLITSKPGKRLDPVLNIGSSVVSILENKEVATSIKNFGEFIDNNKNEVDKIVTNVIDNTALKKKLSEFGVTDKIISDSIPIVTSIAKEGLANAGEFKGIYNNVKDIIKSENPDKTKTAISNIIGKVSDIALNDKVLNDLKKKVPVLLENKKGLADISVKVVDRIRDTSAGKFIVGVDDKVIKDAAVLGADLASKTIQNADNKDIRDITNSVQELITAKPGKMLDPILKVGSGVVNILENKEVATSVKNIGEFIDKNNDKLDRIVTNVIDNTVVKKKLSEFGITDKVISDSIPIVTSIAKEGLTNAGEFKGIYNNVKDIIKSENPDKTKTAISNIIGKVSDIALNDKVLNDLKKKVPVLLDNKKDIADISVKVVDRVRKTGVGKFIEGIDDKVIKDAAVFGADLVSNTIQNVDNKDLRNISGSVQELITAKPEEKLDLILNLGENAANILENKEIAKSLNNTAKFIDENNATIKTVATNFIKNNQALSDRMQEWGIEDELVSKSIETGTKLLSESMPTITEITPIILKDKNLKNIVTSLQAVIKNPKEVGPKEILKIVNSVISLKDNEKVKDALENKLPEILTKNSEKIGNLIDDVFHKTKVGKSLQLNTKKIIEVTAKKIPELSQLSTLFNQKSYGKMIPKLAKFVFDKDFLSVVADTGFKLIKNQKLVRGTVLEVIKTVKDKKKLDQIKQSLKGFIKDVSSNTVINKKLPKDKSLDR